MDSSTCRLRFALAALSILPFVASNAFAWGQEGHRVVATIAEKHMTANARAKVQEILGVDGPMAAVANWADEIRPSRPQTAPWHYIDIPLNATDIDPARDCRNGDCVTAAITRFLAVLRDASSTSAAKNEALKFIIHFVGDLHQPLHCEDNNDRGGNGLQVTFFGRNANLHSVWDTLLIEHIDANTDNYATMPGAKIEDSDISAWQQGTVEGWALESHAVARQVAYEALPPGQKADLGMDYLKAVAPAVDLQLARAGMRLAYILNQVFQ
jgi:S1/P1 Nuclease